MTEGIITNFCFNETITQSHFLDKITIAENNTSSKFQLHINATSWKEINKYKTINYSKLFGEFFLHIPIATFNVLTYWILTFMFKLRVKRSKQQTNITKDKEGDLKNKALTWIGAYEKVLWRWKYAMIIRT